MQARLEDEKQCIVVIIGATPEGKKELVGFTDRTRESAHDWRGLDGCNQLPKLVRGVRFTDGIEVDPRADREPKAAA